MKEITYPKLKVDRFVIRTGEEVTQVSLRIFTRLRKEHEGNWYFIPFYREFSLPPSSEEEELKALALFNEQVYIASMLHIIDPSLMRPNNEPYFELDKNDISEEDRVKSLIGFRK